MEKDKLLYNILLIEDNLGDITLIKEYIEEQFSHASITQARSFNESTYILTDTSTSFDVILLDLSLPDKSGEPLINDILAYAQFKSPVIILTGYSDIDFSIKSISLGVSDYLLKDELTGGILYKSITYAKERNEFKLRASESEKKFSLLFNLTPQPMWVYDLETLNFIHVNQAAIAHYGYTEEEFFNINLIQLHVPEERESIKATIKDVDGKGQSFSGNFRQIKKNGEEIDVEIYSTFLLIDKKPCRSVIAIDVTEKNLAEAKLTQAIIKTQEEERFAIGSELHDNICQILTGTMLSLSIIKRNLHEESVPILLNGIDNIRLASNEIRNLSHRLAPAFFDDMKLKESIAHLLFTMNLEKRFDVHLVFDKELENIDLKKDLQINLYRIMQEQLNNIIKYSNASTIDVTVSITAGKLRFEIFDDGVGFDEEKISKGIGFANMSRRAKHFSGIFGVESSPNNGCKVTINIPLEHLS